MSITFPSLEETKLSSILESLQPELTQVQTSLNSITLKYRTDYSIQLDKSIQFQNLIIKKTNKMNKTIKDTLNEVDSINTKLNKNLDHLNSGHNVDGDVDDLNGLTKEVMGKLWNIIGMIEKKDLTGGEYPILSRIIGGDDDDTNDTNKEEEVDDVRIESLDIQSNNDDQDTRDDVIDDSDSNSTTPQEESIEEGEDTVQEIEELITHYKMKRASSIKPQSLNSDRFLKPIRYSPPSSDSSMITSTSSTQVNGTFSYSSMNKDELKKFV